MMISQPYLPQMTAPQRKMKCGRGIQHTRKGKGTCSYLKIIEEVFCEEVTSEQKPEEG